MIQKSLEDFYLFFKNNSKLFDFTKSDPLRALNKVF
jgi:hypothetical protein